MITTRPTHPGCLDNDAGRSTAELMSAAADGDPLAWEQLIERYARVIWSTVRSFRMQDADARDVVQLTWTRLLEHLGEVRDPDRLSGWLATTARRECLRLLMSHRRVLPVEEASLERLTDPLAGPEQTVVTSWVHDELWRTVDELPPRHRMVIRGLFAEAPAGYADLADRLGMPVGSLGPTRARALRQLRLTMQDREFDQLGA